MIQTRILEGANPILESIGNATTVRNGIVKINISLLKLKL